MPRTIPGARGLVDFLPKRDLTAYNLAYNNTLDRMRMELPPSGDPGASGVVQIDLDNWPNGLPASGTMRVLSASGTNSLPVYLDAPIPVSVTVDIETDSIKVFSASGTPSIPVYIADEPIDVLEKDPSLLRTKEVTWAQLTGSSATSPLYVSGNSKHTYQYTVASIDTNVSVAASGSLDNANWFNLDANDALTTQTTDGTYGMTFDGMIKYTLFSLMAEVGGGNVTIDARYLGGH